MYNSGELMGWGAVLFVLGFPIGMIVGEPLITQSISGIGMCAFFLGCLW